MKTFNKILLSVGALATLGLTACVGDLDLKPTDKNVIVAGSPEVTAEAVMNGIYMNFASAGINGSSPISIDGGFGTFQRAMFSLEVIPTDECEWYTGDADYSNFCYGVWSSTNGIVNAAYRRLKVNIALCNNFLESQKEGVFANEKPELVEEFARQCHVIRGICYFYMIDLFGNVPWIGPDVKDNSVDFNQVPRKEAFENIVAELEDVVAEYNGNATQYYGYVGLEVAEAYLMKFYLNAEVYTGTPMYDKAIDYAEKIIARHQGSGFNGTGLNPSYTQLFSLANKTLCNGGGSDVSEIIWSIPANSTNLQSWANGTLLIAGWAGSNNKADFNFDQSAWNCMAIRPSAALLFPWKDAGGHATGDLNKAVYSDDVRTTYWLTTKDGCDYTVEDYGKTGQHNGFSAIKFTNWMLDENGQKAAVQPDPTNMCGADLPLIRLAEVYLSAAEAYLRTDKQAKADEYVGYIRQRAGVAPFTGVTLQQILDERCRELYTELTRRTDLIRFNQWCTGYNWRWKNQVYEGANFPEYYTIYPLPYSELSDNPTWHQNPGYN